MHHLLAVLGLATALVAPPTRRQTTRLRGTSLAKKGDDYIFEDIAKNLGKGDQDRLYQYQLELAERYGEDKIGRAAPPPKPKQPKQGAREAVVKAVTPPTTKTVAPRNSKLRWRGLVCGAAVALFLTPGFLEYLISVRTKALALEKSLEALVVAVATPAGLITPIVFDAAGKGLSVISAEVRDLATRAKDNKLKPEEFQGGTFTVSNLGMFGITEFSAVVNPPQACILAVGGGVNKLTMDNGDVKQVTTMTSRLSSDRRVVDEPTAAAFLQAFAHYVAHPELLSV